MVRLLVLAGASVLLAAAPGPAQAPRVAPYPPLPGQGWDRGTDHVGFSPSGKYAWAVVRNKDHRQALVVWTAADLRPVFSLPEPPVEQFSIGYPYDGYVMPVARPAWSPDESAVAWVFRDGSRISVVDVATGAAAAGYEHNPKLSSVGRMAFTPDGKQVVVSCGYNGERVIALVDARNGRVGSVFAAPGVRDLDLSPDGRVVATAGSRLQFWRLSTGELIGGGGVRSDGAAAVAYLGDGRRVVTARQPDEVRVWDAADPAEPKPLDRLLMHHPEADGEIARLAAHGNDRFSVVRQKAVVFAEAGGKVVGGLASGHLAFAVGVSRDGTRVAAARTELRVWDAVGEARPAGQPPSQFADLGFQPTGLTFAGGGSRSVAVGVSGPYGTAHEAAAFDVASGRPAGTVRAPDGVRLFPGDPAAGSVFAFGSAPRDPATGAIAPPGSGLLWAFDPTAPTARPGFVVRQEDLGRWSGGGMSVPSGLNSAGGRHLARFPSGWVLLDETGRKVATPTRGALSPVLDAAGGRLYVVRDANRSSDLRHELVAIDARTGAEVDAVPVGYLDLQAVAHDGKSVYGVTPGKQQGIDSEVVRRVNLRTGEVDYPFARFDAGSCTTVNAVVAARTRPHVATVRTGREGAVWVWDAGTGRQLGEWQAGADFDVGPVAFSADGKTLFICRPKSKRIDRWDFNSPATPDVAPVRTAP